MSDRRKGDKGQAPRFRSDRFIHNGEKWYYETREGKVEGPFRTRSDAEEHLRNYIKFVNSGWWNDNAEQLQLEPVTEKSDPVSAPEPEAQIWARRRGG